MSLQLFKIMADSDIPHPLYAHPPCHPCLPLPLPPHDGSSYGIYVRPSVRACMRTCACSVYLGTFMRRSHFCQHTHVQTIQRRLCGSISHSHTANSAMSSIWHLSVRPCVRASIIVLCMHIMQGSPPPPPGLRTRRCPPATGLQTTISNRAFVTIHMVTFIRNWLLNRVRWASERRHKRSFTSRKISHSKYQMNPTM